MSTSTTSGIIRVQKNKDNPYIMLNKTFLDDSRLSYKSKGLLAYLLSKPDNWQIRISDLINHAADGKDSIYSGINELKKYGYVEKNPVRKEGKIIYWESIIREIPLMEIPEEVENSEVVLLPENPEVVNPEVVNPEKEMPEHNKYLTKEINDFNNKLVSQLPDELTNIILLFDEPIRPLIQDTIQSLYHTHKDIIKRLDVQHIDDALFKYREAQGQRRIKNPALYFQKCLISSVQEYSLQEVNL